MRENVTPVTKIVPGQSLYQEKRGVLFLCVCFFQFHVILNVTLIHNLLKVLQFKVTFWSAIASPLNEPRVSLVLMKLGILFMGNRHNKIDFYVQVREATTHSRMTPPIRTRTLG